MPPPSHIILYEVVRRKRRIQSIAAARMQHVGRSTAAATMRSFPKVFPMLQILHVLYHVVQLLTSELYKWAELLAKFRLLCNLLKYRVNMTQITAKKMHVTSVQALWPLSVVSLYQEKIA